MRRNLIFVVMIQFLKACTGVAWLLIFIACNGGNDSTDTTSNNLPAKSAIPPPANINYEVLNVYPHDTTAFTQGLVFHNGQLFEGTGHKGQSTLRKVELASGRVDKKIDLEGSLFGEGITIMNDTIYQLTWEEHIILIYTLKDMKLVRRGFWQNQGWGITHDNTSLIISDGSDKLYFVRPGDFKLERVLSVNSHVGPADKLNELEYIDGYVYANQWGADHILKIDPATGFVVGMLNFKDILKKLANINLDKKAAEEGAVLNGIAWDAATGRLFVTGKYWPKLLEIKLSQ